jgi:hypothetical protein
MSVPPPNNKFLTSLIPSNLKVNTEGKKYESGGYTYDYVNYGTKFMETTAQLPTYLPTKGMREWTSDSGSRSYTMLVQFPNIDVKSFEETGTVKSVPPSEYMIGSFQLPDKSIERRVPTEEEVLTEVKIFNFYAESEKEIKKQAGILDNGRFAWNGAIQVRNKMDPNSNILEGEFYPVSIRFKVEPKININDFCVQNESFEEVVEGRIKLVSKRVNWSDVVDGCFVTVVHNFGRIFRITKKGKVECGWHLFLKRISFLPCMLDAVGEAPAVVETFLPMPCGVESEVRDEGVEDLDKKSCSVENV